MHIFECKLFAQYSSYSNKIDHICATHMCYICVIDYICATIMHLSPKCT